MKRLSLLGLLGVVIIGAGCTEPNPYSKVPTPSDGSISTDSGVTLLDGIVPCGPKSCAGCCKNGACHDPSPAACGENGSACITCPQGNLCRNGICMPPASCSATCGGCCAENGQCLVGFTNEACGSGGMPCVSCDKLGKTCDAAKRTCVETPCEKTCGGCCQKGVCQPGSSNQACGSGGEECETCQDDEVCQQNQCEELGPITYQVYLMEAKLLQSAKALCGEANCDLLVKLVVKGNQGKSPTIANKNNPSWNPLALLLEATEADLTSSFSATVWDEDYGYDDKLGSCNPSISKVLLQGGLAQVSCYLGGMIPTVEVTFVFVKK